MLNNLVKQLLPPIVLRFYRSLLKKNSSMWQGNYASWQEAKADCEGYEAKNIIDKVLAATLKVKNGEAVYERDSVLFDEIQYSWGLLSGLLLSASQNKGSICVVDFGGSLGSTYSQNKKFLDKLNNVTWCVVEQQNFVEKGKAFIEDNQLKFYSTIEECFEKHTPNVLILSSVLQYLEKPYEWLDKFLSYNFDMIIIDRTAFITGSNDILTKQNVPSSIYKASYPAWFFNEARMIEKVQTQNYTLIEKTESYPGLVFSYPKNAQYLGHIFKKNK